MLARSWNVLRREPLVHFMALALLLFVAYRLLGPPQREPIVIERARVDQLVQQQADLLGRPLTDEEREALIKSAIDDEVLLREAYRRGLDRDAVVQRHLVQKMRLILAEDVPAPTEAELKAYFAANRDRYRGPPTVTSTTCSTPIPRACRTTCWRSCKTAWSPKSSGIPSTCSAIRWRAPPWAS